MSAPREESHRPRRELAPFVEAIHWSESPAGGTYPFQHLPDGRAVMLFRLTGEGRGDLSVAGPRLRARFKLAHRIPLHVRVVFRAGCAAPFLGAPVHAVAGDVIALTQLWGVAATELGERLAEAREPKLVVAELERVLLERRRAHDVFEPAAARMARRAASLVPFRCSSNSAL